MVSTIIIVFMGLLFLASCDCPSNQVYVKMIRRTGSFANEESFLIRNGRTPIFTSPIQKNNNINTFEECLPVSQNHQYTLSLLTSGGNRWGSNSWLEIYGINGNIVFKGNLVNPSGENYGLSLYAPINKNEVWKFSSTIVGNWYDTNYIDNAWSNEVLGSTSKMVSGTQYFRKAFIGIDGMAAYELSLNYQYGVIAYINGVEVYRDFMPDGVPSPSTFATGSYPTLAYRSVIRPGYEVSEEMSILAVELHFLSETTVPIDFNGFLAIYASTNVNSNCYTYPYPVNTSFTYRNVWDWNYGTVYVEFDYPNIDIPVEFDSNHAMYVNGIRLESQPLHSFWFSGKEYPTSQSQVIFNATSYPFVENGWTVKLTRFHGHISRSVTLSIVTPPTNTVFALIKEMQALVCNLGSGTTIPYVKSTYEYTAVYDLISISPMSDEFVNCSISPQPPVGLSFVASTCTLHGIAQTSVDTEFTVVSVIEGQEYTGVFTLKVQRCIGSMLRIRRITKLHSYAEAYTLTELATKQVIDQQVFNGDQMDNSERITHVCVTQEDYRLSLMTASNAYYPYSVIVLELLLSASQSEVLGQFNVDHILGTPSVFDINTQWAIAPFSNWFYKMGSVPTNWFSSITSGWSTGKAGTFPDSSNQIQLYKKNFQVQSLTNVPSFVMHIRFNYGIIVYLNNNEIYRKGVEGELSESSVATSAYSTLLFRSVLLPVTTTQTATQPMTNLLHVGSNTIAIALVAQNAQQVESTFDCVVRLSKELKVNRFFDATVELNNVLSTYSPFDPFLGHYQCITHYFSSGDNSIQVEFNNDRREWISSIVLQNWYALNQNNVKKIRIEAKNAEDSEFTLLKEISDLIWSSTGQSKKIWLDNNKAYNQYRFSNIGTNDPSAPEWKLNRIGGYMDIITQVVPELVYQPSNITLYKFVEMAEIYPNSELFKDFSIQPALPEGVIIDPLTGMISGTATQEQTSRIYTVTAHKYNTGETVTTSFFMEVIVCTNGKSLITLTVHTDSFPDQGAYQIFEGLGTKGRIVTQVNQFPVQNSLFYSDMCLTHGFYTLRAIAKNENGWRNPAGYVLSVDVDSLRFEMNQVPSTTTTSFSSFLPFQMGYDLWKVYKDVNTVPTGWNAIDFDDSTWTTCKTAEIGSVQPVTVYLRKSFVLDSVNNYRVLNVQVKYEGGIVAYFNGRKVARFNLDDSYNDQSMSIDYHNPQSYSKFHVILSITGGKVGENVMAFEVHKSVKTLSTNVVFDATGVFGVNECSIVVDSFETLTASTTFGSTILQQWELAPFNSGQLLMSEGLNPFMEWVVENLEGSRYNNFGIHTPQDSNGQTVSLYGYFNNVGKAPMSILHVNDHTFINRQRMTFYSPLAFIGFRHFRMEIEDMRGIPLFVSSYMTQYCEVNGTGYCPGEDKYPAVYEGQISVASCDEGFSGYSYRQCTGGKLGEIKTETCFYKPPAFMEYPNSIQYFVLDVLNESSAPTYQNIINTFYLDSASHLPPGLEIDAKSGRIRGKPTSYFDPMMVSIIGSNPIGVVSAKVTIGIRDGKCVDDGIWKASIVGTVLTYDCSLKGPYMGVLTRECILGEHDGEWLPVQGMCVAYLTVMYTILGGSLVILVIYLVAKMYQRKKAMQLQIQKIVTKNKDLSV